MASAGASQVCDRDFAAPLWLLAARRDTHDIALDFYFEESADLEPVVRMASARSLMLIASPSYFRSFEPILRTLRASKDMPFQQELVACESVKSSFLLPDRPMNAGIVFEEPPEVSQVRKLSSESLEKPCTCLKMAIDAPPGPQDDVQVLGVSADVAGKTWSVNMETTKVDMNGEAVTYRLMKQPRSQALFHIMKRGTSVWCRNACECLG